MIYVLIANNKIKMINTSPVFERLFSINWFKKIKS